MTTLLRFILGAIWRLYQIICLTCGVVVFYLILGDATDARYPFLWICAAFVFGFFFTWGVTILTNWAIDRLYGAFSHKPLKQDNGGLSRDAPHAEGLHRLRAGEQPDDFITLSPRSGKHLR